MANRRPGSVWALRLSTLSTYVRTTESDAILIRSGVQYIELSRKDARLLAKRINQCLDATVKR